MFQGSIVALITLFRQGKLDEEALLRLVEWHIEQGTHGIVPVGTTGESPTLTHDEHCRVVELVVKQVAGRIPVIAGAGSNNPVEAIEYTLHAERVGADIEMVRQGIGSDQRIGYQFIYPGCGYGGSCFPKDVKALLATAQELGYDTPLIRAVERVNELQKSRLFQLLSAFFRSEGETLAGKTIALWGLAFKPNTDDMREAPSRALMEALWQAGATVQAYDPEAMQEAQQIYGNCDKLRLMGTKEAALFGADALVICTEWNHFKAPNFAAIKQALKRPLIVDGRNLFDPGRMKDHGFHYYAIGRGESVMK